jgi:flagellin-like hook-associated protein FlgL
MASNITLSAGVRQNLLALQNTADLLGVTQNRLATGKKVNSALDNPTNFFTSSSLSARASDLSGILDAMANGISTLQAANNGLTSITKTVESMQATINQARQDASWKSTSYSIDTTTIGTAGTKTLVISGGAVTGTVGVTLNTAGVGGTQGSLATASAYAAPTTAQKALYTAQNSFAAASAAAITISFTSGNGVTATVAVTLDATEGTLQEQVDKINAAILLDSDTNGVIKAQATGGKLELTTVNNVDGAITVTGAGEAAVFGTEVTQAGSDGQYVFGVNGTSVTLTTGDSPSLTTAINTANLQLQAAGSAFEAYDAGSTKLGFREKVANGTNVTITGTTTDVALITGGTGNSIASANAAAASGGTVNDVDTLVTAINNNVNLTGKVKATNDNGKLNIQNLSTSSLTLTGVGSVSGKVDGSVGTSTISGNTTRTSLVTQFNDLRNQLDKLADDASFNGVNLLKGDALKLVFNETNTSSISIQSQNTNGINVSTLSITTATGAEFSDNDDLDTRLTGLRDALTSLRSQSSAFGSNLSIVQNRQDFTKAMITTLQTGSDTLVLADTNEEAANVLALQTRQQLSTTALSLANQASQGVLRLF